MVQSALCARNYKAMYAFDSQISGPLKAHESECACQFKTVGRNLLEVADNETFVNLSFAKRLIFTALKSLFF